MRKKLLVLLVGLVGLFAESNATSPLRRYYPVKQSDGTSIHVMKQGNGRFVFYATKDGAALVRGENGDLQYAKVDADGLSSTGILAHEIHLRTSVEQHLLSNNLLTVNKAYRWLDRKFSADPKESRMIGNEDGLLPLGTSADGVVSSIGAPVIPVIMVSFPDRDFLEGTTIEKVGRMLNEQGYQDERYCKGSVKDYFTAQSNGLFVPSYKIVAKVKMSKPYAYYGENYLNGSIDKNVSVLISEALDSASLAGVDFTKFVGNDGRVPLVSIYHAGPGEHSSFEKGCENYLWAHFSKRTFSVDGVGINSYFVGNETLQNYKETEQGEIVVTSTAIDGIGILVHEFGHALGLPDFYSTARNDGEEVQSMHFWSVMDYGQYFYDGYAPIGYNAFERASLGWLDLKELTSPQFIELYPFGQEKKGCTAYCIKNKANPKEYYILENRQPGTWYSKLMGNGMLITHVDYEQQRWHQNNLNTEANHQRFEFVPADNQKLAVKENGKADWNGFKADLFPGTKNVTEFSDTSLPAANVYVGGKLQQPIYNIKEQNGVVSFSFLDKNITGIEQLPLDWEHNHVEVYTLTGNKVHSKFHLLPGVYIIKNAGKTSKVYVK